MRLYVGLLELLAKFCLGALHAQSEGQGNLSMHPQGDNLYGYGSHNTFSGLFQARFGGSANTPGAPGSGVGGVVLCEAVLKQRRVVPMDHMQPHTHSHSALVLHLN